MKVLSDILHKAGILKEGAEVYSSGGYSVVVRNATTQRLETVASTAFANIYTADGSLLSDRTVTMGNFTLSFEKDLLVNGLTIGKGSNNISTNTVFGFGASGNVLTTSQRNVFIGYQSGQSITSGGLNVAVGQWSLNLSTTANNNVAIGYSALDRQTTGNTNTAVGGNSMYELQTGTRNTAVGFNSGRSITTGSFNTIIGAQTVGLPSNLSNNIILADGQGNIRIRAFNTGNVTIGGNTDAGYKFDVQGTAMVTGDFQFGSSVYAGNVVGFKQTTSPAVGSAYYYMYANGDLQRTGLQIEHRSDWPSGLMVGSITNNVSLYGVGAPQLTFNGGPLKIKYTSGANVIGNWGVVALPTTSNTFTITTNIQDYHNFSYLTAGSFLIGGNSGSANGNVKNYFFGGGADLASNTQTERSVTFYATFPDSQTDSPGGNFTITGGRGTGTGTPGDVIFSTATATSTGTTLQSLTNRVWIKGENGNVGIGASPNAAYKLDVAGTGRFTNMLSVITTGTTNDVALFKSTEPYITVEAAGGSNSASIFLKPSTSSQNATIQNRTGGGLEFYVNADYTNAKMTIKGTTVNIRSLPTSATGLSSGDLWNDGGTLKVA